MTLKDELPWLLGANMLLEKKENRKNEEMKQKWKKKKKTRTVVDITGDGSKVQCCKEHY